MQTYKNVQMAIGADVITYFSGSIEQSIDNHHSFSTSYPPDRYPKKYSDALGERIKISMKEKTDDKEYENTFMGLVTEAAFSTYITDGEAVLLGKSPTILMDGAKQTRSFSNMNLAQIVNEVLKDYPQNLLNREVSPQNDEKIPYIVQYGETDFNFLSRVANFYSEWFFYDGMKLIFGKLPKANEYDLFYRNTYNEAFLSSRIVPVNIKHCAYHYLTNKSFTCSSSSTPVNARNPLRRKSIDTSEDLLRETLMTAPQPVVDKQKLEEWSARQKNSLVSDVVTITCSSEFSGLRPGQLVMLKGFKEVEGKYLILSITHVFNSMGEYSNSFKAIPAEVINPPKRNNIMRPFAEPQLATVTDNNDPDGLGRVRVRFIWDQQPTPWLRVLSAHAGDRRGAYILPEVNDQVLVGFEQNNPDRPFIYGSLYHGEAKPNDWKDQKNHIKAFRSKSGNEISFVDAPGKEEIRISNKDGGNQIILSLDQEGKIAITSKGNLELSATNIKIEAQQSLQCSAQAELKLETTRMSIQASGALDIDGGGAADIKAGIIKLN